MAEFCKPCPLKGSCTGDIVGVEIEDLELKTIHTQPSRIGRYAVAFSVDAKPSEPIRFPEQMEHNTVKDKLVQHVEECKHPVPRLLARLRIIRCGAVDREFVAYDHSAAGYLYSKDVLLAELSDRYTQSNPVG